MIITSPTRGTARVGATGLALVLLLAFLARAVALWWTRPEFMGWFNHAPWYWVQVRGLLETGALPFADLPLLFHLYSTAASGLVLLGVPQDAAVVHAQRFFMCLVPALVAWPCWAVLRRIFDGRPLGWAGWALVAVSAFLPLNFAHMPELLQKNALGVLLLAALMAACFTALVRMGAGRSGTGRYAWLAMAVCLVLIALTHLGTLAAALLWLGALTGAVLADRKGDRQASTMGRSVRGHAPAFIGTLAVGTLLCGLILKALDPASMGRIAAFVLEGWQDSPLGLAFGAGTAAADPRWLLALLPALALIGLALATRRARAAAEAPARMFWRGCLLFAMGLVLPCWSLEVLPRFVLFLPLPLLFVLGFHIAPGRRPRLARLAVAAALAACVALVAGETANLLRPVPDKAAVRAELAALDEALDLGPNDLVIAPYAVAPVANWFLGARSSLVTAVNREDFERYERVFVLNTGWEQATAPGELEHIVSEADRYRATRRAVPLPSAAEQGTPAETLRSFDAYRQFAFHQLLEVPDNWRFDAGGRWSGVTQ